MSVVNDVRNFAYTGNIQEIKLLKGAYKIEAWGGSGGMSPHTKTTNNSGGYSSGILRVEIPTTLFIVVGGVGTDDGIGGYNGGGSGIKGSDDSGGGGGATHVAKVTGLLSELESLKSSIVLVAGGGGGNGCLTDTGGAGGGLVGMDGIGTRYGESGTGGTQTSPGITREGASEGAGFGIGGSSARSHGSGGGGSGLYGGSAGSNQAGGGSAGGGGSGYVSSALKSRKLISGIEVMPSPFNDTEVGHRGNGHVRIIILNHLKMLCTKQLLGTCNSKTHIFMLLAFTTHT